MSYNLADQLTSYQKQVICQTIMKQEIKKAKSRNPEIYENHLNEPEFWQGLASKIAMQLFQDSNNYYDSYEIQSKGNLDGKGFRVELLDSYNKEKFFIDYTGDIGPAEEYTPPSGGCYVATCVYGSYDCPQVWTLRRFRDNTLSLSPFGRAFIRMYYTISPMVVKCFGSYRWFHKLFKKPLDKWVKTLNSNGVENTPYND